MRLEEVVITGVGVVSPIGVGKEQTWDSLVRGQSGVGPIRRFDPGELPVQIAGEVEDFDLKAYVKPRKNLKLMARDTRLGVVASTLARQDAGLGDGQIAPERFGVILGSDPICGALEDSEASYRACIVDGKFDFRRWATEGMAATFPLSFLKVLPNMVASHVSIAHDARGPCNTIHQGELSSLLAVCEATRVIQRGVADVMIAGGASSQLNPYNWIRLCIGGGLSTSQDDPATVLRPFDADRNGQVHGEGAAAFILESRPHAEARGATILARVRGCVSTCEPRNGGPPKGTALRRAMRLAMEEAGVEPHDVGHVNAHGVSSVAEDQIEAQAIQACLPDVPVTAPKSYFGNLGASGGAVEMSASVLSLAEGLVPPTLNYRRPDPRCPVRVVREEPLETRKNTALAINWTRMGQVAAVLVSGLN
ncbi:MAG: beta-ketoacyl-[acyl-carrier-protein] synthase family protein [Planctomycetes bacterium]|nr:beta-ketoacyl-[acyl-carrier-protein] synthase family protein [Planctomycetota bacterium]